MKFLELLDKIFKSSEDLIYAIVGILLILTGLFLLFTAMQTLILEFRDGDYIKEALHVIDRILLTIMVVEILYTVRVSIQSHVLCAEPFLVVALIAAVRRILVISVESAYMLEKFKYHMIEIGILGALIFIFVLSIILLKKNHASFKDMYKRARETS